MASCAVKGCGNNQKKNKNVHFYRFPKDTLLCAEWVKFCDSDRVINTKHARMCSIHFTDTFNYKSLQQKLLNYSPIRRRRLLETAVPSIRSSSDGSLADPALTPDTHGTTEENISSRKVRRNLFNVTKSESAEPLEKGIFSLVHDSNNCPYQKELQDKLKELKNDFSKKEKEWKTKISILEDKLKQAQEEKNKQQNQLDAQEENSKIVTAVKDIFTPGQIRRLISKKNIHWSAEDISAAISLRSVSPKGYRYLRNHCKFPLPSLSTLRCWAANFNVLPGLLKNVLTLMEQKSKTLSSLEKLTVISFDEMYLKSQVCLEKKTETVFGPHRATQVIMTRGLYSNWKQPIYYNFDQPVTKEILETVISSLCKCNYIVVAMVSDMGSTNMKLWSELGIDINTTHFKHPVNDNEPIFVFADVPHLLKLLRNHFLDSGFVLHGKTLTKGIIENFLEIAAKHEVKIAHKLTKHHLDVKGSQRQKVKTAAQLFSHTTSKLITYCGDNKLIADPCYKELASFVELVDKWFDLLNSSQKFDKKGQSAYGVDLSSQNLILDEMTSVMTELRSTKRSSLLPFQKGIIVTNKSLKGLYMYLHENYNLEYVITRRLNQDILENFFSRVRAMGGANDNPNPLDFMHRLKWYILGRNSQTDLSQNKNCEADDASQLTAPLEDHNPICLTAPLFMSLLNTSEDNLQQKTHTDLAASLQFLNIECEVSTMETETTINTEGIRYLAGYVAYRYKSKYPDLGIKNHELPSSSNIDWIDHLSQGGLMQPSSELLYVAQIMETQFLVYHGSRINKSPNIIKNLVELIKQSAKDMINIPDEVLSCLVRTRTYIRIRELNKESSQESLQRQKVKKMAKICQKQKHS